MCQQGGIFVLQLFDNYAATYSLLFIGLVECVVLSWVYGKTEHPHADCLVCSEPKIFYAKVVQSSPKHKAQGWPWRVAALYNWLGGKGLCLWTLSCDFAPYNQ